RTPKMALTWSRITALRCSVPQKRGDLSFGRHDVGRAAAEPPARRVHPVEPHASLEGVQVDSDPAHGQDLKGVRAHRHHLPRGFCRLLTFYARVSDRSRLCPDILT